MDERTFPPLGAAEINAIIRAGRESLPHARLTGHTVGGHNLIVPVYKVRAWRRPNEDGAARPVSGAWLKLIAPAVSGLRGGARFCP